MEDPGVRERRQKRLENPGEFPVAVDPDIRRDLVVGEQLGNGVLGDAALVVLARPLDKNALVMLDQAFVFGDRVAVRVQQLADEPGP